MAAGVPTGTIGTIGFRLKDAGAALVALHRDHAGVSDLQALLAVMQRRGAQAVALEVARAMALRRVDAIGFDAVGFLNLGRDHLDFHHTIEDYFEAKARLFEPGRSAVSVIWVDDERGQELARRVAQHGQSRLVTVGTTEGVDYLLADYEAVAPLGGLATVVRGERCSSSS